MVEKLIEKVIKDAEEKKERIIKEAENKLADLWAKEKEKIENEFKERIETEKRKIRKYIETEIGSFKLDKEKEILYLKNNIIEEILKKIEIKFNKFLEENIESIVKNIFEKIEDGEYNLKIPNSYNFVIDNPSKKINIIKSDIENSFIIEGKNWDITFNWNNVKVVFQNELIEEINKTLL